LSLGFVRNEVKMACRRSVAKQHAREPPLRALAHISGSMRQYDGLYYTQMDLNRADPDGVSVISSNGSLKFSTSGRMTY
jgi:hypothetical protein